jgi:hypothetical protein
MWRRALIPKWQLNGLCAEREVTVSPGVAAGSASCACHQNSLARRFSSPRLCRASAEQLIEQTVKLITHLLGHPECSPKQFSRNRARLARLPSSKRFEQLVFPHGGTSLSPFSRRSYNELRAYLAPGVGRRISTIQRCVHDVRSVWGDPVPGGTDQRAAKNILGLDGAARRLPYVHPA